MIGRLAELPEAKQSEIAEMAAVATKDRKFIPNPGPQTDAYFSKADILLYGGSAGGGKSAFLAGLAIEEHHRSLLVRRQGTDLGPLVDEVLKVHGSRDGFNGSHPQILRFGDGKQVKFGGIKEPDDWEKFQGDPRDLLGVDEAAQLLEIQVKMLMGWVRTDIVGQRTRTVMASNPPLSVVGEWMIGMFRPWLDLTHHNPAEPGELRWYLTDPDGKEQEAEGPEPHQFPGESGPTFPKSRTFIPADLGDNPYLTRDSGYRATLDAMQEPHRSALRDGNFMLAREDDAWQLIPTTWVLEAQARWGEDPPEHAPMSAMGVDVAQGGDDQTVIAARYDNWFAPLEGFPGKETPNGPSVAGLIIARRKNNAVVVIDMGGGYGGSTYDHLTANVDSSYVRKHVGAEGSVRRTADQSLGFKNKRSEVYWRFREALDPANDMQVALPDDPELRADLTAATYDTETGKIRVEKKTDIVARLGRSPDKGDAVVMAWSAGPKLMTHGNKWRQFDKSTRSGRSPNVNLGRSSARRRQ